MKEKIIAWDLGTGGNKASLYDIQGNCLAATFVPYNTGYPDHGWHEQRPADWWDAVVSSTKQLVNKTGIDKKEVVCCGISGHSLGAVPIGADGKLLRDSTPIWSDSRASMQAKDFISRYDEEKWYLTTGNGFPPQLYTIFKIMWYRDNEPEMYNKIHKVIGTKDYINFLLTGKIATDPSYASGCGVYDLLKWHYSDELIAASQIPASILPEIVPSTQVIGKIKKEIADKMGLGSNVNVVAGGVDNSCMALGAKAFKEGRVYNSLGSSSWIAVSSQKPLLDARTRPYVFTHVLPGMFASALCIASGGTSFRWVKDNMAKDLMKKADENNLDIYDLMTKEASNSPVGANKLLFNPSLGGGMPMDRSANIRGAFMGLDLKHSRSDVIRASMEGISMGLRLCLDELKKMTTISDEMLIVGGGSKSALWRQIYADIYRMKVVKSNVDQQAAALGAAAVAAVGTGLWSNFEKIDEVHQIEEVVSPLQENMEIYEKLLGIFKKASDYQSELGNMLASLL